MLDFKVSRLHRLTTKLAPKTVPAVEQALTAGIPEATISDWLATHGEGILKMVKALIDAYFLLNPNSQPAPQAGK